ncbi:MerR family transcriptional regulator [Streptomyces sp. CBMA123]|uniref:MerR family transcriptional regulator n=1 Tax=Streptomyces sp. CBMA123 TaxID=1896313 RepID=UPI001661BC32|nr:MerR family transcriptional regulator [Streptomyces sp. CBMA123]MBD0694665.1 transcriptional regulator [Streptomyces sp. CBMA123]
MRISELSRRSAVPTATIKYYLREGLLPPGRATAATQAEYDESHLRRLRLVRALIGVRGLSVSATREVLGAVAEHAGQRHQVLGLVLGARPVDEEAEQAHGEPKPGTAEVDALIGELGWEVSEHAPARAVLGETLETLRTLGAELDPAALRGYAELAERTAVLDLDQLDPAADPLEQAERALLRTVLLEPALLALRRLAQENESARRER